MSHPVLVRSGVCAMILIENGNNYLLGILTDIAPGIQPLIPPYPINLAERGSTIQYGHSGPELEDA